MGEDESERDHLMRELYSELHRRAERWMRSQPRNVTLQTTALVNEACLKILASEEARPSDRVHLLALASTAMRHVLVDHARSRARLKRSPPGDRTELEGLAVAYEDHAVDLLALDEALRRLAEFDPPMARAVELRFFGGMSVEDTARVLGLPKRTFERCWEATRAWLRAEIG
jgi:RNA polymerase sigma factor (TIGR02999 family)